jgi:hypothetical protein
MHFWHGVECWFQLFVPAFAQQLIRIEGHPLGEQKFAPRLKILAPYKEVLFLRLPVTIG